MEKKLTYRLYEKYADVIVPRLGSDELDRQIVEIGRCCHLERPEKLYRLLKARKEERWNRKVGESVSLGIEKVNRMLRQSAAEVYEDTLDTAKSMKKELDATGAPYLQVLQAQCYVEEFDDEKNKFADEENDLPGLLDILMDIDMMKTRDIFNITFILTDGEEIQYPAFEELFLPGKRDVAWNRLLDENKELPVARLCFPLRKLYMDHDVAIEDIIAIRRFGFYTECWKGVR